MSEDEAQARATRRASWPVARYALGSEPDEDLRASTTAAERLDMMWRLAVDAWVMSGRPWPQYSRAGIPGRVYRQSLLDNKRATGRAKDLADVNLLEKP